MRVDWCVSSWFRIKNTHSHNPRVPPGFQHDGVVIVPLPRDHGNEEELRRDLQRVSSAALGYDH